MNGSVGRRAAILSIGDELVQGQTLDRNSAWLSERLISLGVSTIEHRTVADDVAAIAAAFSSLAGRASIVISSGGLGPTPDDLTREAMAIAFDGSPQLVEDESARATIERW
ncbi:MAG: molybdopterin-binding protein, partial [Phycisphaerales bacterium]